MTTAPPTTPCCAPLLAAPLDGWDAWTIWNRKAIVLLNSGSIDPRFERLGNARQP